jgi:HK97 family phage major capsid protein
MRCSSAAGRPYTITTAESLGAPSLDTDLNDADWTTELQTGTEDTAMRFGKRELRPHPVAKLIKVSKKLLRASALPIEGIIQDRLAYKFGVTQEKAFLTGTGTQQPLGVFTASNDGIPTSRDVSTGNTTTSITFDGLIEAKYSLKGQYWNKADWLFHRDALKQVVKLKDGDGQYIWRMSVRDGEPDTLLGRPIMMSEYAPNTFTTGLYVGLFGDFSNYWIVDSLDLQVQRLVELYAATNQDGFIGRLETDGAPVLAEAFARVKLA